MMTLILQTGNMPGSFNSYFRVVLLTTKKCNTQKLNSVAGLVLFNPN